MSILYIHNTFIILIIIKWIWFHYVKCPTQHKLCIKDLSSDIWSYVTEGHLESGCYKIKGPPYPSGIDCVPQVFALQIKSKNFSGYQNRDLEVIKRIVL